MSFVLRLHFSSFMFHSLNTWDAERTKHNRARLLSATPGAHLTHSANPTSSGRQDREGQRLSIGSPRSPPQRPTHTGCLHNAFPDHFLKLGRKQALPEVTVSQLREAKNKKKNVSWNYIWVENPSKILHQRERVVVLRISWAIHRKSHMYWTLPWRKKKILIMVNSCCQCGWRLFSRNWVKQMGMARAPADSREFP